MKTNAGFKLSKTTKAMLGLMPFKTNDQRHAFRHMMIEGQVAANTVVKNVKDRKEQ
ncbi:hypothetical protein UFOVP1636_362 [uncultured Caudovirales phage]|jgi:hypothetical protein|uniref:Uncharacterized protein n=1 Tax=uncultured Caudovirales phage TaxID=2100421 RepID=A0A6J5T3H8_9CAUD|nr:hypothetical protein UFOVP1636_362 [uncultured Caudovirales phage]